MSIAPYEVKIFSVITHEPREIDLTTYGASWTPGHTPPPRERGDKYSGSTTERRL